MHADITRDTFDPARHFSRVLMQQGRVPLDADLNEQSEILLRTLRTLTADLIGPHAGPRDDLGFRVQPGDNDALSLSAGRYYVNGIPCQNEDPRDVPLWETIPASPGVQTQQQKQQAAQQLQAPYLVYLEVYERLVTAYHHPLLRETALGGPDTAARTQVVWRVRTEQLPRDTTQPPTCEQGWKRLQDRMGEDAARAGLRVRAGGAQTDTLDPCVLPPDARYRGMENQLYRVEVHTGGEVSQAAQPGQRNRGKRVLSDEASDRAAAGGAAGGLTFKWSRENGSVIFAIRSLRGVEAEVETLGLDPRLDLSPGDWVEITDDVRAADGPGVLARVADVDRDGLRVTLEDAEGDFPEYDESHAPIHPLLRRWDQSDPVILRGDDGGGAARGTLVDGAVHADDQWIELESGISVRFEAGKRYQPGDYWLIPARVATGDVEWPLTQTGNPRAVPARRPERYLAPLGIVLPGGTITDCRRRIREMWEPAASS